ncbi:MAG: spore coat protein [Eubacteriales bacterium]
MKLTVKEDLLVKDLISAEKLSIEKYQRGAEMAKNGGLKNLFSSIRAVEQAHLDTLNSILAGSVPQAVESAAKPQVPQSVSYDNETDKSSDQYLCSDGLSEEKQISSRYEVSIFEFAQPELRKILNKIQAEEQAHGQYFYEYMNKANMYN